MESKGEILIYKAKDGSQQLEVRLEEETIWLTQQQMAKLFGKSRVTVTEHIRNIFKEKELKEVSVCRNFRHTAKDGKSYEVQCYNLDVIISIGYRVNSKQGTQFRQWATQRLKDHLIKGYTLNEKRQQQMVQNMRQLEQAVKLIQQSALRKFICALFRHSINTHISLMIAGRNTAPSEILHNTMRSFRPCLTHHLC